MAQKTNPLTKEMANKLFTYKDGDLFWKTKTSPCSRVNVGQKAGTINSRGYMQVGVGRKLQMNHRIIFLMHHGYLPKIVDHIDGNKVNNKIENLRAATDFENKWNLPRRRTNTSGVKGVTWHKAAKKWWARCNAKNKIFSIGYFDKIEDAKIAIDLFRKEKHGDFANNS